MSKRKLDNSEIDSTEPPKKKQKASHVYPTRRRKKRPLKKKKKKKEKEIVPHAVIQYGRSDVKMRECGEKDGLLGLRALNNFVKSVLIEKYTFPNYDVLDIACGKGGDLGKYSFQRIRSWTGVDIVYVSLKDAMRRYNARGQWKFESRYICCDIGKNIFFDHLPSIDENKKGNNIDIRKFDLVSCQFAAHYLFGSKQTFSNMMRNITTGLKRGGCFICTITDGEMIKKKFEKNRGKLSISNGMHTLEFVSEPKWNESFGNKLKFTLPGAIYGSEEYVVNHENFKKDCETFFQLKCEEDYNFLEYIDNYRKEYKKLEKTFLRRNISNMEWETSSLYRVMVFRKNGKEKTEKAESLMHRECKESEICVIDEKLRIDRN